MAKPVFTPQQIANQITRNGYHWDDATITYSFPTSGGTSSAFSVDATQKAWIREAVTLVEDVIDVSFVEVSPNASSDIEIRNNTNNGTYASWWYDSGRNMFNVEIYFDQTWSSNQSSNLDYGSYGFTTILHEFLHGIGLSHPGNYNGFATYQGSAEFEQDTDRYTVMSYFSAHEDGSDTSHYFHNGAFWQWINPQTPMVYDVLALQQGSFAGFFGGYPVNTGTRTENTVYGYNSTANRDVFDFTENDAPVVTIVDAGGTDTLDLSGDSTTRARKPLFDSNGNPNGWQDISATYTRTIDLREGSYSSTHGMTNNLAIAFGTIIENVIGTDFDDFIIGNSEDNTLFGGAGDDNLTGNGGNDTFLYGLPNEWGDDTISDFTPGVDQIAFDGVDVNALDITQVGNDVRITMAGADGSILVEDTSVDELGFGDPPPTDPPPTDPPPTDPPPTDPPPTDPPPTDPPPTDPPPIDPPVADSIAELQTFELDHQAKTITLANSYENPVVIARVATQDGSHPVTVRIEETTSNSVTLQLQEPASLDGWHVLETVSLMVVEAGSWLMEDGSRLEAGTIDSNKLSPQGFESISFDDSFDATPAVLSQVQTLNGGDYVATRQKDATTTGFSLTMQEEEAKNGGRHVVETIGWIAIERGSGTWNGIQYEAGTTAPTVDHDFQSVTFDDGFSDTPTVVAGLSTFAGGNPAVIRTHDISANGFDARVQEDQSQDSEVWHVGEAVDFFAAAGDGTFTGTSASSAAVASAAAQSPEFIEQAGDRVESLLSEIFDEIDFDDGGLEAWLSNLFDHLESKFGDFADLFEVDGLPFSDGDGPEDRDERIVDVDAVMRDWAYAMPRQDGDLDNVV